MKSNWEERNTIVANLFNPAFCGEVIRTVAYSYNKHSDTKFPFVFAFISLPILLHKRTRNEMPRSIRTYFFVWVEKNDSLFFDFPKRTKGMVQFTKEAIMFLLTHKKIRLTDEGGIDTDGVRPKASKNPDADEYNDIIKKAEMLGKWLAITSEPRSIFSFFRITP